MAAKLVIEIECAGDVFNDHRGKFSPEPELVSILMGFCTGALTNGLDCSRGCKIPIRNTIGQHVGQARFTMGAR